MIALLVVTAVVAIVRFVRYDPRTRSGLEVLDGLRARHAGSNLGSVAAQELPMAVALHGTAVLVGTPWEALHTLRQQADAGSGYAGGDANSGCDDGGGGDGGGCGD